MSQEYLISESARVQKQVQPVRRSQMETYCDIMHAISTGAEKPSHIMHKANLSWAGMTQFLRMLESSGLVTVEEFSGNKSYRLSDAGFKILHNLLEVKERLLIGKKEQNTD